METVKEKEFLMSINSNKIKKIYEGKVAKRYDYSMPPFFLKWKQLAFNDSSLKNGDTVLVFCCGSGLDFPFILNKIGKGGKIIGVDFSSEMLSAAKKKIEENNWKNITLMQADVTTFNSELDRKFNIGVCTLGMSIIPDFKAAYRNLLAQVKENGEIIIGDMQLAPGWLSKLNPFTIFLAKKFGGTHEGHQNSLELCELMKKDLTNIKKREFFFKSYFYCIGKVK